MKFKSENLSLTLLQEQYAELEKQKNFMEIEAETLRKEFNSRISLMDSEMKTVCLILFP